MLTDNNIEDLKRRIDNLKQRGLGEKKIRKQLINRTLRSLDWDVIDEEQVEDEYPIPGLQNDSKGRVDYALLTEERKPAVFVEAKKLGNLGKKAVEQVKEYGLREIIRKGTGRLAFLVTTDGNVWEFHPLSPEKGLDHYKDWCHTLNIETDDTSEIRDDLNNLLARQNVLSGDSSKYLEELFIQHRIKETWESILSGSDEALVDLVKSKMTERGYKADREEIKKVIFGGGPSPPPPPPPPPPNGGLRVKYRDDVFGGDAGKSAIKVVTDVLNHLIDEFGIGRVVNICAHWRGRPLVLGVEEARRIREESQSEIFADLNERGYVHRRKLSTKAMKSDLEKLATGLGISDQFEVHI